MSYKALDFAMQASVDTSTERLVLVCLAWHMNDQTGRCDPSVDGIKARTLVGIHQVRSALASLEAKGLIRRIESKGKRTQYDILISDPVLISTPSRSVPRTDKYPVPIGTPSRSVPPPRTDEYPHPVPISTPNKEVTRKEQGNISSGFDLVGDQIEFKKVKHWFENVPYKEIVEAFNSIPGVVTCQELSDERKKLIKARYIEQVHRCNATNPNEGLEVMEYFFRRVRESDFLCGRVESAKGTCFRQPIDWFFNKKNFLKVMENVYANRLQR